MSYDYHGCAVNDGEYVVDTFKDVELKEYREKDLLHSEDGPAVCLFVLGMPVDFTSQWWWRGERINVNSQEEFEEKLPYLIMKDVHDE